jgi:fibronectin-binding autotransporter adhesin
LIKNGSGVLALSAAENYTGNTTINTGILRAGIDNAFSSASAINNLGTLDLNNHNVTLTMLTGTGTVSMGSGNLTLNTSSSDAFDGVITGNGSLIKAGSATLTLNGTNTYTGNTNINAGILSITNSAALGSTTSPGPGTAYIAASAELDLSNNISIGNNIVVNANGTLLNLSGNNTITGNVTLITSSKINVVNQADTLGISGIVSGTDLNKYGAGNLLLLGVEANPNTYTGSTNVFAGGLTITNDANIPSTSPLFVASGATIGFSGLTVTLGSLSGSGTIVLAPSSSTTSMLVVGTDNSNSTYSGSITGTGSFEKVGTGTLTMDSTNNYTGFTNITGGTVIYNADSSIGTVSVNNANLQINPNATVTAGTMTLGINSALVGSGTSIFNGNIMLGSTNSSISTTSAGDSLTVNGNINGASSLVLSGAGNITLNGNIGATNALTSFTTSNDSNSSTTTSGSITTIGTQTFNNAFIVGGATTLTSNSGNIQINNSLNGANDLTLNSTNGNVVLNTVVGSTTPLSSLTTNAVNTLINSGAIITAGNQTYNNLVTVSQDTTLTTMATGNISLLHGINSPTYNLTLAGTSGDNNFTLSGSLSINNITVTGSATGNNTFNVQADNVAAQNWTISAANTGSLDGVITNTIAFSNIQNITGGNDNNNFTLNGGTLNGIITGGSGNNVLYADNVTNNWTISSNNSGSVTGVNGFASIQNLVGGNQNNTFTFYNNGSVASVNGNNTTGINTLNYMNDSAAINVVLTSNSAGSATVNGNSLITSFQNINNLVSNGNSTLNVAATGKTNVIHITGPQQGYVNDPTDFSGFSTLMSPSNVNTTVIFDVPGATFNPLLGTMTYDGLTISFIGITGPPGTISGGVTPGIAQIATNAISSATAMTSSSAQTGAAAMQTTQSISNNVNDNLEEISNNQSSDNNDSITAQKVSTNCT